MSQESGNYDGCHIQVLEGWEAVRKRPGMYIGSTGQRGLHQLVFEVASRAVNEVLAGRATRAEIALLPDGGVRVADDGPGLPFENSANGGTPGLEAQLTQMGRGPARGPRYPVLDFCGVGPFPANALSSRMAAEVEREGVRRVQQYVRGVAVTPPADAGATADTRTVISFWPDPDIFETTECSFDVLAERFRELAFLNHDLDVSVTDERDPAEPRSVRFRFPGGVRDEVAFLDEGEEHLHPDVVGFELENPRMGGTMEVALRWRGSGREQIRSFANHRPTPGGGTHVAGFHDGLKAAVNAYARERSLLTEVDPDFSSAQIGEGLIAVVSVKLEWPGFEGATRGVLVNAAVRDCVGEAVAEHLGRWLEECPQQAAAVMDAIVQGARRD